MLKQLESAPSFDGADQGFLASYFPDLLDRPMFRPLPPDSARLNGTFRPLPSGSARLNGTFRPLPPGSARLNGMFRLPLGYQMDHVYYCECA